MPAIKSFSIALCLSVSLFSQVWAQPSVQVAEKPNTTEEGIIEHYPFDSDQQRQLFNVLTKELRCPKCQNQNIADSNAGVAMDLKNKTYQLVKQGKSKQDVVDYMVARYGNFVYYQPPMNWLTIWLWLLPVLLIVGLSTGLYFRRKQADNNKQPQTDVTEQQALLAEAERILAAAKSNQAADNIGTGDKKALEIKNNV